MPSPPLALFVVILPKAHLTSHSRMSGSRWVMTPSWLSGLITLFLYSSSVYSCHLYLLSSAYVRSFPFLSFIEPIFAWNIPLVSLIFLKRSLVFPILLFSSISLHCSLKKAFLFLLSLLFSWQNLSIYFYTLCFFFHCYWVIFDKHCMYLRCTMWWFDLHIHCEIISTIKPVNISTTS